MKQLFTLLFLTLLASFSQAQTDPLSLSKAIFSPDSFPALKEHITKGYNGHPNGTDLPENATCDFLLLEQTEDKAVVNVTITDSEGLVFDAYLHFVHEGVWKVTAFRALAMTGIIEEAYEMLTDMTDHEIDSIIYQSQAESEERAIFTSWEEYTFEIGNMGLTLSSDQEIINHFQENQQEFNRIKDEIIQEIEGLERNTERSVKVAEKHVDSLRKIYVSSVSVGGYQFGECFDFLIGGMLDNAVGYLLARDKNDLPKMNPDRVIMIREIGNGWYLYKTT